MLSGRTKTLHTDNPWIIPYHSQLKVPSVTKSVKDHILGPWAVVGMANENRQH